MKLLSALFAIIGTFLLAPQIFPATLADRVANALQSVEASCRGVLERFHTAVRGFHRKDGFLRVLESFAIAAALTGLVLVGYLWVRFAEPSVVPARLVNQSRVVLGLCAYAGFYGSAHFFNTIAVDHRPVRPLRLMAYAPLLLFGALPAALGFAAMIAATLLGLLVPGLAAIALLNVLRAQHRVARWAAAQKPDRTLGWVGLALVAAAALMATT